LAWEANGPGQEFQKRVLETDFRDFYYRKQADVVTKRSTNKPGYWTQKRSELLGPYREALMEGQYVNPDAAACRAHFRSEQETHARARLSAVVGPPAVRGRT
jgi:hypothetical protein